MNEFQFEKLQNKFDQMLSDQVRGSTANANFEMVDTFYFLFLTVLKGDERSFKILEEQLDTRDKNLDLALEIAKRSIEIQKGTEKSFRKSLKEELLSAGEFREDLKELYLYLINIFELPNLLSTNIVQCENNLKNIGMYNTDNMLNTFVHFYKGSVEHVKGNFATAIQHYQKSAKPMMKLGNLIYSIKLFNNIGTCYLNLGDLENAELSFRKALEFAPENMHHEVYHYVLFNIGLLLVRKGDLNDAVHYLELSRKLSGSANDLIPKGRSAHMIGVVYDLKGKLAEAEFYFMEARKDFTNANYEYGIALCVNSLGNTYFKLGNYEKAYEYFTESYKIFKELNLDFTYALYNLFTLARELGLENSKKYYRLLQENPNDVHATLAKIVVLKSSNRYTSIGQAKGLLEDLIESPNVPLEQKILALLELLDILLNEYQHLQNRDILKEIREKTDYLDRLAQSQHSYWQKVQVEMLKAQMYLIERNSFKARRSLAKAQNLAERYNFQALEAKISIKMDELVNMINRFDPTVETEHILEEMGITSFKGVVKEMIRRRVEAPQIPDEEGVVLLIIHHDITVYSYIFDKGLRVNEILIGSFISALKMLLTETFDEEGPFDMIRKGENIILYKEMGDFGFCYVIKGNSYHARKKVLELIRMIGEDKDLMEEFNRYLSRGIVKEETAGVIERYILHAFRRRGSR